MRLIVDRFEGEYAVCEVADEKRTINIAKSRLPDNVREGDVLEMTESSISIDSDETASRKEQVKKLMDSLWE